jgi:hypothetical protein
MYDIILQERSHNIMSRLVKQLTIVQQFLIKFRRFSRKTVRFILCNLSRNGVATHIAEVSTRCNVAAIVAKSGSEVYIRQRLLQLVS